MAEEVETMRVIASVAPPPQPRAMSQTAPDDICVRLSARDADQVFEDFLNPPKPNEAALRAAKRFEQDYG